MRDIPCPWAKRLSIAEMLVILKLTERFSIVPVKITAGYLLDIDKLILESSWKIKESTIAKNNLKKKSWKTHYLILRLSIKLVRVLVKLDIQISGTKCRVKK